MGISDIKKKKDAKKSVKKDAKKVTEKKEAKKSEEKKDAKKVTEKKETKKTVEKKETKKTASNKTANKNNFKDPFEGLMVKIEPGMYRQPIIESKLVYPNGDKRRKLETRWEKTEKLVTIEKGFKICKYLVTQKQWNQIMGEETNNSEYKGDDRPVDNCSLLSIANFIQKLNSLTGKKYRLPTKEEWTWAAMGAQKNNDRSYFAGAQNLSELKDYACFKAEEFKVGKKKPNEIGLYDMQSPKSCVLSNLILKKDKEIPYYLYRNIGAVITDSEEHYEPFFRVSTCNNNEDFCRQTIFWPGILYEIKFDAIYYGYIRLALDED